MTKKPDPEPEAAQPAKPTERQWWQPIPWKRGWHAITPPERKPDRKLEP